MELKIVQNEELVKTPNKWLIKNFELVEENEKMFVKFPVDHAKELRIFFKNTLLEPEKREHIKKVWASGEGIDDLIESLWIVKSSSSGVLLFVPYETEASDKSGVFVLTTSKSYFYPNPLYFKRSHINNQAVSLFYSLPKSIIFLLGENNVCLVYNQQNRISLKKYVDVESLGKQ
jgi:hypothetical protein